MSERMPCSRFTRLALTLALGLGLFALLVSPPGGLSIPLARPAEFPAAFLPVILRDWFDFSPVVISEVLYDPSGNEPDGEWIELYNPAGMPIDLAGYKLGDAETSGETHEGMFRFPQGAVLSPGGVVVVAVDATVFVARYGFEPDYELASSGSPVPDMLPYLSWASGVVQLGNGGDELLLLDGQDRLADALSWGDSTWAFSPSCPDVAEGHSLERYPPGVDRDSAVDWRNQEAPAPGGVDLTLPTPPPAPTYTPTPTTTPTPTHTPTPTATPAPVEHLVISELLYAPQGAEPAAEWIEIYNPGSTVVDLTGYMLGDEETRGGGEGMLAFPSGAVIAPDQVIVIANQADVFSDTYGVYPDYEMVDSHAGVPDLAKYLPWANGGVQLANSGDEVLLMYGEDYLVDALSWGSSAWAFDPPVPAVSPGYSLERRPANVDTDTASDWQGQPTPDPGGVSLGLVRY